MRSVLMVVCCVAISSLVTAGFSNNAMQSIAIDVALPAILIPLWSMWLNK